MKPLLHIKVKKTMPLDQAKCLIKGIKDIKDKISDDYNVIISPEDLFDIKSEGPIVNITFGENGIADRSELAKVSAELKEYAKLAKIAAELKEYAKLAKDSNCITSIKQTNELQEHIVPNKNKRSYNITDTDQPPMLAPRGTISPDGKLNIATMDIIASPIPISMKLIKSRSHLMPILCDPFADFETSKKNGESFHNKFMEPGEYLNRSYDGDPNIDPEKCLDEYWIPIINKVNQSGISDIDILPILKSRSIDPTSIVLITVNEKLSIDNDITVLSIDMKVLEDSTYVTLVNKSNVDGR